MSTETISIISTCTYPAATPLATLDRLERTLVERHAPAHAKLVGHLRRLATRLGLGRASSHRLGPSRALTSRTIRHRRTSLSRRLVDHLQHGGRYAHALGGSLS